MEWKPEYSLGIIEIDGQHQGLLKCFGEIERAMASGKGWTDVHYAIVDLTQKAHMHFEFEEALQRLYGYPDAEQHGRTHGGFFIKLQDIERHALTNSAQSEMVDFLREWLTDHILLADRDYAQYIIGGAEIMRSDPTPHLRRIA